MSAGLETAAKSRNLHAMSRVVEGLFCGAGAGHPFGSGPADTTQRAKVPSTGALTDANFARAWGNHEPIEPSWWFALAFVLPQ
jgi:hypothetical protein